MSPLDAVSSRFDAAGTTIERIDTDRLTELASDLAASDVVTSAASSAASAVELMNEQLATMVEHGRHTSRNTRIALVAGVVVLIAGTVILIRRRRRGSDQTDTTSSNRAT